MKAKAKFPAWERETAAAEKYNEPGRFTALIGYEWTSGPNGNNLHRNVIFRDGKDKADTIIPLSYYDTGGPEDLWKWMADYEKKTGGKMLAIAHNGNLSNGLMFDDVTLTSKQFILGGERTQPAMGPGLASTKLLGGTSVWPAAVKLWQSMILQLTAR